MQETEEDKVVMMCWENMDGSLAEEKQAVKMEEPTMRWRKQNMKKNMLIVQYIQATD